MTISDCYNKINQYQSLSKNINAIISKLDAFGDDSKDLIEKLEDNYLINNKNSLIYDRVSSLKSDTNKTSNYLQNTILPAISSEINRLYRLIRQLEAEAKAAAAKTES